MGWHSELHEQCGLAPKWVELLPECAESARQFLGSLHAMVPGMACCAENWPRVGLEAMAAGVPIVAEAKGGWTEMLNGSGVLVDSVHRQAYEIARLAYNEQHRMGVIIEGRKRVEALADPEGIWAAWKQVFGELS
jgi:glycosyltransferase involved in cell wall biosynthesis